MPDNIQEGWKARTNIGRFEDPKRIQRALRAQYNAEKFEGSEECREV